MRSPPLQWRSSATASPRRWPRASPPSPRRAATTPTKRRRDRSAGESGAQCRVARAARWIGSPGRCRSTARAQALVRRTSSSSATSNRVGGSPADEGGDTVSEGQAYGMLLAVALGDEQRLRHLWSWTDEHLQRDDGLLAWRWADGGIVDHEAATDADLLAAAALALAGDRGDADLTADARLINDAVLAHEVVTLGTSPVLVAGPWRNARAPSTPATSPRRRCRCCGRGPRAALGTGRWSRTVLDSSPRGAHLRPTGRASTPPGPTRGATEPCGRRAAVRLRGRPGHRPGGGRLQRRRAGRRRSDLAVPAPSWTAATWWRRTPSTGRRWQANSTCWRSSPPRLLRRPAANTAALPSSSTRPTRSTSRRPATSARPGSPSAGCGSTPTCSAAAVRPPP